MYPKVIFYLFFLAFSTSKVVAQEASNFYHIDEELSLSEIDDGVYLVSHSFPWQANSLAIRFSNDEILLIDTPYTGEATEKLINSLTEVDSVNTQITAINTHFHMDNLGGNEYLQQIGAIIYGSDMTVDLLQERGLGNGMVEVLKSLEDQRFIDYWSVHTLAPPNKIFTLQEGLKLSYGDQDIEIYYPGGGHAPDNVVVYYPGKRILFGGCLIKSISSSGKGNIGDAVESEWTESVRKVKERYKDAEIIIPGHGPMGNQELFDHTISVVQ